MIKNVIPLHSWTFSLLVLFFVYSLYIHCMIIFMRHAFIINGKTVFHWQLLVVLLIDVSSSFVLYLVTSHRNHKIVTKSMYENRKKVTHAHKQIRMTNLCQTNYTNERSR